MSEANVIAPVLSSEKREANPSPISLEDLHKQFKDICHALNIDEDSQKAATTLLEQFYNLDTATSENAKTSIICSLFLVASKGITGVSVGSYLSLSQLLRHVNIKLLDFFEPLKHFIAKLGLPVIAMEKANQLERKYLLMRLLFEKYERLFESLFKREKITNIDPKKKKKEADIEKIFRFGWTLYIVSKGKVLGNPPDLIEALHLLLCCVDLLFVHMPNAERRVTIAEIAAKDSNTMAAGQLDTLKYICGNNSANPEQVRQFRQRIFTPFMDSLTAAQQILYQPAKIPTNAALSQSYYLGGLLDSNLDSNLKKMGEEYEFIHYASCDFDERLFLKYDPQLQSPARPNPTTPSAHRLTVNKPVSVEDVKFRTPQNMMTPTKAFLTTVGWLQSAVKNQPDGPTDSLINHFDNSAPGIKSAIESRIASLMKLVSFPNDSEGRKQIAVKLYYKILEEILRSEEARLKRGDNPVNFSTLLNNEKFHKSLLACCIEIVAAVHKVTELQFPAVPNAFELKTFDFLKIVETVVRHEPTLPRPIVKELINIEEKILEQLAWEENSPVYQLIGEKQQRELLLHRLSEIGTPSKPANSACQVFSSPISKPPSSPAKNSNFSSFEYFVRKVAHLAALRIRKLCLDLNESPEMKTKLGDRTEKQIEMAFIKTTLEYPEIFKNRHIDQIIMCTLYGICKLNRIEVTFRVIIEKYMKQPQANTRVYRVVLLNENATGDIIKFYNAVFIPSVEKVIVEFKTSEADTRPIQDDNTKFLAMASPFKQKSPQKVQNLVISPMKTPLSLNTRKTQPHHTPAIYQFGVSPVKDLDQINKSMNTRTELNSARRSLNFSAMAVDGANGENAVNGSGDSERQSPSAKRKLDEFDATASTSGDKVVKKAKK
jgi:retinoblastoma-associated protein